jgi:fructose-1,6-bisphosphatase/inositol monophosphatase family enzyme
MPLAERLQVALSIAREAGRHTLKYFQQDNYAVERKADDTPVTVADREAELLLRERIAARFPHDAILGEEFPDRAGASAFRWILDPIDGTQSFITGVPLYSTLVGVEREGQPAIGVIVVPALGEAVWASIGGGAFYSQGESPERPARVSNTKRLADSRALASSVEQFHATGRAQALADIAAATRITRRSRRNDDRLEWRAYDLRRRRCRHERKAAGRCPRHYAQVYSCTVPFWSLNVAISPCRV